ncbi:hypothetical protein OIU80_04560 [Flavobacterium sp. LS1R47]|uniref:Carboxypeptidase-like regulatory domain-containing protein n=1 Tax=Flavobacterium frigoritolerans TaxID=2987686 RepID=A0A9X3C8I9_9FLAO|nr:hypothetical protein [Flavobacterium frigoritolerans]MCV9931543.1 hypothetical protein [Flavobacterium frigoritolerans]
MKVKLLTTISLLTYQIGFSQTEKLLNGKVISQNHTLKDVEVINKTAKTSTKTNASGEFSILVRAKDSLIFFKQDYFFTRLKVSQENIRKNNISVDLVSKPEELNEVVITTMKLPHIGSTVESSNEIALAKNTSSLQKYTGVYNGTITNGMDFIAMGEGLIGLFKGKEDKKSKNKTPELDFKKLVNTTCPSSFFTKDLKLSPEEKELFLEFCDADPRSKALIENKNILSTMDFLYAKNEEFKKVKINEK